MKNETNAKNNIPFSLMMININGIEKTASQWSQETGVSLPTIRYRYKIGFKGEELINPNVIKAEYEGQIKSLMEWSLEKKYSLRHSLCSIQRRKEK